MDLLALPALLEKQVKEKREKQELSGQQGRVEDRQALLALREKLEVRALLALLE